MEAQAGIKAVNPEQQIEVPRLKKKAKVIMFNKVTTEEQYPQHIGD
jgi:hypothetical protein